MKTLFFHCATEGLAQSGEQIFLSYIFQERVALFNQYFAFVNLIMVDFVDIHFLCIEPNLGEGEVT